MSKLVQTSTAPSASDGNPFLKGLNAPQREAVLTTEGPVLMLAGAGTGKTAALTHRLAHLVAQRLAWPSEILCVTFTNRAAREMRERVGQLIGPAVEGMPWLGTFHAIGAKMLRRHAELAGLQSNFTIIDTDDQLRLLKQLIQAEQVDDKRWPAKQLAGLIDRWKNRGFLPTDLDAGENEAYVNGKGQYFYQLYQDRLKTLNACDFGDLLLHVLTILRTHRDVLEQYQQRFKYIMVDEYQDTNAVQYLWLRLLAQARRNLCVVGDDDQSIYSWRGAEVANILRFERDFPGAKVIRLEQNYRSTPAILGAASGLIAENAERLGKTLWTEANGGDKVRVIGVWDGPEEARRVGEDIERLEREGLPFDKVAILVRAQFQTREFEDRFISIGLPYRIVGGFRFYERAEIRDAIAYLRLISQPSDDLAFERIVNAPKRGLGDKTIEKLHRLSRANGIPLAAALHDHPRCQPPHLWPVDQLDPVALYRRIAGRACRCRNHDVRRRIALACTVVRTFGPVCRCRARAAFPHRHPRARLATRGRARFRARPAQDRRKHALCRQLCRQAPRRYRDRRAGVPRQVRHGHRRRAGRQQARDRVRRRRPQARDRQFRSAGLKSGDRDPRPSVVERSGWARACIRDGRRSCGPGS